VPKLIMMEIPGKTRQVSLKPHETRIGRAPTNDIVVDADRVSRAHASIVIGPTGATLNDLGSRNGTFVDGMRIAGPHALENGDSIRIGSCEMRFLAGDAEITEVQALRLLTIPGLLVDIDRPAARPASAVRR
jgi:pSer/pThr/pTyr-binding forkhead associated (FHA) protein